MEFLYLGAHGHSEELDPDVMQNGMCQSARGADSMRAMTLSVHSTAPVAALALCNLLHPWDLSSLLPKNASGRPKPRAGGSAFPCVC
jgi:hypothetical protein